jgi:hypothetical protein
MKELPDDELDKLFKKSAEELDSTFDPQDWNALRNRLDSADGKTPAMWWRKWWPAGLLALLMIGGIGTYLLINNQEESDKNFAAKNAGQTSIGPAPAIKNDEANTEIVEKKAGANLDGQNKDVAQNEKTGQSEEIGAVVKRDGDGISVSKDDLPGSAADKEITKTKNTKILPRRWSKTGGVYLEPNRSIGRGGDGAFNSEREVRKYPAIEGGSGNVAEKETLVQTKRGEREVFNSGKGVVQNADTDNISESHAAESIPVNASDAAEENRLLISAGLLESRAMVWNKAKVLPKVKSAEMPVSQPIKTADQKEPSPKFAVRFSYSPDLSTVGLKNLSKPGTAVSLLIEYALFRKLYIQTGVARSSKIYNAKAGEYEWPASWSDQKVLPSSVDGVCKIIEIPLNVRYDITQTERSRWFTSAGASSYYMQNEKYDYNYDKYVHDKWSNYETSTGWYWLSHLNASVGYEYRLSKKLSLIAEPYVRIPVKKVGFGKVDLFTFGTWFSIRYTPSFK